MKLILDLVINHSSNEHEWFKKSVKRIDQYTDFYVWKNAKDFEKDGTPIPPNRWVSNAHVASYFPFTMLYFLYFSNAFSAAALGNGTKNENNSTYINSWKNKWILI